MFKGYICIRDSLPEKYSNKKTISVVLLKVISMPLLYVHVLFVEKNYYAMNLKRFDPFFY